MRKIQLTEMVLDFLAGGNAPQDIRGTYHPAMIEEYVNAAYNDLIFIIYTEGKKYADYSQLEFFSQTFSSIAVEDDGDLKYVEFPFPPVQVPDNMGIRLICPQDDPTYAFAFLDNNTMSVFSELEVNTVDAQTGFWVERASDGAYRAYLDKPNDALTHVKMRLVVPLSEYDEFDQVPIPAGREMAMRDLVVQRMQGKPPAEKVNDNVPQT